MIVLKYQKIAEARFISHIDLLRHTARVIRRAKISVKFSNGFNPHALIFFSPPLVVGVSSVAEYVAIDCNMSKEEVLERYNASVPKGLEALSCFECEKNPNLQAKIVCADYIFPTEYKSIDMSDGFVIEYSKKGEKVVEDVADKIFAFENNDGKLLARLACGSVNLRPDRIIDELNRRLGAKINVVDIKKVAQYVQQDGTLVDVDEFLKG